MCMCVSASAALTGLTNENTCFPVRQKIENASERHDLGSRKGGSWGRLKLLWMNDRNGSNARTALVFQGC